MGKFITIANFFNIKKIYEIYMINSPQKIVTFNQKKCRNFI